MLKINKIIILFICAIMLFIPTAKANSLHNMQDKIPTDNADAYATIAGALFYQIKF